MEESFLRTLARRSSALAAAVLVLVPLLGIWNVLGTGDRIGTRETLLLIVFGVGALAAVLFVGGRVVNRAWSSAESARRLASLVESCHDSVMSFDSDGRITNWNPSARRVFGFTAAEAIGTPISRLVPTEVREEQAQVIARLNAGEVIDHYETVRLTKEARRVNVSVTLSPIRDIAGRIIGASEVAHERSPAEQALRESEERFRLVAASAPVMIWVSDVDGLYTYFNRAWLEFTGRPIETELGNGWADGVHPDDVKQCLDTYTEAFVARKPFRIEYRLRRHDGEYRWILNIGVPTCAHGAFTGYIGSATDVTDHKRARILLAGLSRRLMDAHEKESARIARELHDDIAQRIAVLAIEMRSLRDAVPAAMAEARALRRIADELADQADDLARDIQSMSHHLHSSQLDYLGIAAAAAGLCRELSRQHNVEITCRCDGIPKDLPKDVALGLYRVLQEAISNALKHARVTDIAVVLQGRPDDIELAVTDAGIGFDPDAVMRGSGLGLTSMRERLALVNGEMSIESRPGGGTTIRARVRLNRRAPAGASTG